MNFWNDRFCSGPSFAPSGTSAAAWFALDTNPPTPRGLIFLTWALAVLANARAASMRHTRIFMDRLLLLLPLVDESQSSTAAPIDCHRETQLRRPQKKATEKGHRKTQKNTERGVPFF